MVASDFDGLRGYRTLKYDGQVPTKPYNGCFSIVFQASVCIATYGMSVPSLNTESTDSVISLPWSLWCRQSWQLALVRSLSPHWQMKQNNVSNIQHMGTALLTWAWCHETPIARKHELSTNSKWPAHPKYGQVEPEATLKQRPPSHS